MGKPQLPDLPSDVAQAENLNFVQFVGPRSDSIFNGVGISMVFISFHFISFIKIIANRHKTH